LDGGFDSENISLALDMTAAAPKSRLFDGLDPSLYSMLQVNDGIRVIVFSNLRALNGDRSTRMVIQVSALLASWLVW
jgi:hypothetical protein